MFTSASTCLRPSSSSMALRFHSHPIHGFKDLVQCTRTQSCILSFKPNRIQNTRPKSLCAMNMTAGQSGDPGKINLDHIMDKARKMWESCPQPVKTFPWNRAMENFIQFILDLFLAVFKYLCVPVLAVSSLSEIWYCAREGMLWLVPVPLLLGVAFAGVLREMALEQSPLLKVAEVPWHLIATAIFLALLKLPGPYYPYLGRVFIPHFATGGFLRILYFTVLWYRRPKKALESPPTDSS
ncbi:uncharacterized protein LOC130786221 isoform X2 [Actinidia eriantha]|uniref:uncharacterized protein LOC130786221 isoform X2 n=1 Tax=Actinidia eriantha TaxID=165200 RepID=UPI00258A931A|nr:uncharacterized protein LOC130786221 isoform X2 [Actinidia eriantha]